MTRSRDFSKILGRSVANDTFSVTGSITPLSVTSYDYDSAGQLQALNNSSLVDGSLHYLSKTKQLYVWDDSDNSYYPIDQGDSALEGAPSYTFQGSVSGYTSGGGLPAQSNIIDKFSFATDANATDVGDLTKVGSSFSGQSSDLSGYTAGGATPSQSPFLSNIIDKFPFSADGNSADVGDLTVARYSAAGQSSADNGYTSGGQQSPSLNVNVIDKFPFSTDTNATDVGDLTVARKTVSGNSSTTHGYTSGGIGPSTPPTSYQNIIDKFPFTTDANATDVGDLLLITASGSAQSSTVSGYISGGFSPTVPGGHNIIQKFPFSSDANATDVGDLTDTTFQSAGQSSTVSGYVSGGQPTPIKNVIEKFSFTIDANSTDVGDLTVGRINAAGQQV